jgi:hypothetical protein
MTGALFIMFFMVCGPFEMFCEQGRMIHPTCAAAEAWLMAQVAECRRPARPAGGDRGRQ